MNPVSFTERSLYLRVELNPIVAPIGAGSTPNNPPKMLPVNVVKYEPVSLSLFPVQ